MTKKKTGKAAPKTKAAPKVAQPAAKAKKVETPPPGDSGKAKTKQPSFLKPFPTDYIVGTKDYAALIQHHNKLFDTHWLKWRVQPQVFYTIHERVWKHYNVKE